jgi:hypothetical protein
MNVIVCGPDNRFLRRRYQRCPIDQCISEQVVRYELWHGPTVWCCKCGDSWGDGELLERPFLRGWRKDAVRDARRLWDRATYGPAPTLHELDPEMFPDEPVTV